jgi:hypothetical protein
MPTITRRVDKRRPGPGWWSDKERYQAVSTYLILGKFALTAAATGIPEETLRRWRLAPWWKEAVDEIKKSSKIELNAKISNVINKSLEVLSDRLDNGDFFFNPKTGAFDRKGINASVASRIANDLIQKTVVLDKEIVQERETPEGLDDRLKKLAEEMVRFSKAKTIDAEVVNESVPEAVLDVLEDQAGFDSSTPTDTCGEPTDYRGPTEG